MRRLSAKRRGESEVGGIILLLLIGAGVWFFFIRSDGPGRGLIEKPNPVVATKDYEYSAFGTSRATATIRNVGGDGKIKVNATVNGQTRSTLIYLKKGEQQAVIIEMTGVTGDSGGTYTVTATAD